MSTSKFISFNLSVEVNQLGSELTKIKYYQHLAGNT